MRRIQSEAGRREDPSQVARPNTAPPGSADLPWLLQLLRDEPGMRFFAAQFLHLSAPLLTPWVNDRSLTRWVNWLEEDRDAPRDAAPAGASRPPSL